MTIEDHKAALRAFSRDLQELVERHPTICYHWTEEPIWSSTDDTLENCVDLNGIDVLSWYDGTRMHYENL